MLLKSFKVFFAKKHQFFRRKPKFRSFGVCISNNNFWKAYWRKVSVFNVFYTNFNCFFFEKKHLFFQKTQSFERLQNRWAIVSFETHLKKKLAKLSVLESFQNVFFQAIYLFFWKRPNSVNFESSWAIITFGKHSRWN